MADIKQEYKSDSGENFAMATNVDPKNMQELTQFVQSLLQGMQDKFQTILLDEMGNRIDDLEKNIADLMTQAGVESADK
ncbi:hypothetical protein G9C98_002827 [Cotesia typhae]|uniref:Heat shock factor-binding protein 1 n=1 Tax=Cotesia typhae TaxID=2053667 RepID=A0A8J5R9V3_9HYME|nr:hypothetical protein G9C98_002827 [Cotesia typhae]